MTVNEYFFLPQEYYDFLSLNNLYIYVLWFFTVSYYWFSQKKNTGHRTMDYPSFALMCILIILIASSPAVFPSDKQRYAEFFREFKFLTFSEAVSRGKDIGYSIYSFAVHKISHSASFFFLFSSAIYVSGHYFFCKRFAKNNYRVLFLANIFTGGFIAYGNNTIRNGLAFSFFLMALALKRNNIIFYLLLVISVSMHKSLLLPILVYVVLQKIVKLRYSFYIWITCLGLTVIIPESIITVFIDQFGTDDRIGGYITSESSNYKVGFRIDFIIYSLLPLVCAYYYICKLKFYDSFYISLLKTYILSNSLWLLIIRVPSSDRFAYLSWFLIPILLIYPFCSSTFSINKRNHKIALIIFLIGLVPFYTLLRGMAMN